MSRPASRQKIAHFDCASGVSGDMCLGALVDAGLDLADLKAGLAGLGVRGYRLRARAVRRAGLRGTQVEVIIPHSVTVLRDGRRGRREQMTLDRMIAMTRSSQLPERVKTQAVAVFTRLRAVEAKVHGHHTGAHITGAGGAWGGLHALGTPDTVIDVVGTVWGLHLLGVGPGPGNITASPLNTGMRLAPASAELLRGHPIYSTDLPYELTTPTGAALITTLASRMGPLPPMRLDRVGVGAGEADPQGSPNLLRLLIGEPIPQAGGAYAAETILQVETDIDDLNPQVYEYLMGRLLRAGAFDVTLTPLIMKKGRPGTRVTVLARPADLTALAEIVFDETTTLGLRVHEVQRLRLPRTSRTLKTRAGSVRVKVAARDGRLSATPEYEDCRRIAQRTGRPLTQVMDEIRRRVRFPLNLTFSPKGRRKG